MDSMWARYGLTMGYNPTFARVIETKLANIVLVVTLALL